MGECRRFPRRRTGLEGRDGEGSMFTVPSPPEGEEEAREAGSGAPEAQSGADWLLLLLVLFSMGVDDLSALSEVLLLLCGRLLPATAAYDINGPKGAVDTEGSVL